jgi:hypothetical protein
MLNKIASMSLLQMCRPYDLGVCSVMEQWSLVATLLTLYLMLYAVDPDVSGMALGHLQSFNLGQWVRSAAQQRSAPVRRVTRVGAKGCSGARNAKVRWVWWSYSAVKSNRLLHSAWSFRTSTHIHAPLAVHRCEAAALLSPQ